MYSQDFPLTFHHCKTRAYLHSTSHDIQAATDPSTSCNLTKTIYHQPLGYCGKSTQKWQICKFLHLKVSRFTVQLSSIDRWSTRSLILASQALQPPSLTCTFWVKKMLTTKQSTMITWGSILPGASGRISKLLRPLQKRCWQTNLQVIQSEIVKIVVFQSWNCVAERKSCKSNMFNKPGPHTGVLVTLSTLLSKWAGVPVSPWLRNPVYRPATSYKHLDGSMCSLTPAGKKQMLRLKPVMWDSCDMKSHGSLTYDINQQLHWHLKANILLLDQTNWYGIYRSKCNP